MRRLVAALVVTSLLVAVATDAGAHGDVHPRIDALTVEIAAHPDDPALRAQRGRLYEVDENWRAAADDLRFARSHGLDGDRGLAFALARALSHTDQRAESLPLLDALVATESDPSRVDERLVRARVLVALDRDDPALGDYAFVLSHANPPAPEYFVEAARSFARRGDRASAFATLRNGTERIGPGVSLVSYAISLARDAHDTREARAWLERLPAPLRASAQWQLVAGDIAAEAHDEAHARVAWRSGLAWIDALPLARRRVPAMVSLRADLEQRLAPVPREPVRARSRGGPWTAVVLVAIAMTALAAARIRRSIDARRRV